MFKKILTTILGTVFIFLSFALIWMNFLWPNLSMEELIYTLSNPVTGVDRAFIYSFIKRVAMPALLFVIVIIVSFYFFRKNKKQNRLLLLAGLLLPLIFFVAVTYYTYDKLNVYAYYKDKSDNEGFIDANYVYPENVTVSFPDTKRNLIYIYLESVEVSDADENSGGAFAENYIPNLTEISMKHENFSGTEKLTLNGAHTFSGGTWTMGGIFSQSAGVPLNMPINSNDMEGRDNFFPSIITLGDILEEAGYSQYYLLGSEAKFAGRDIFYFQHGDFTIYDYPYMIDTGVLPKDYFQWWGYEDEKLFEYAIEKLIKISKEDEPFNFTMLTADTHFEDGYVCDLCENEYPDNQYANVLRCSDRQVSKFISWIMEQDFYENTTIVLSGDHPTMDADFMDGAVINRNKYIQTTYLSVINAAVEYTENKARDICSFDLFPTTLAALGADIEGNRLALGTNLYSDEENLIDKYGYYDVKAGIKGNSPLLLKYGGFN